MFYLYYLYIFLIFVYQYNMVLCYMKFRKIICNHLSLSTGNRYSSHQSLSSLRSIKENIHSLDIKKSRKKFIVVTGGVISGIGKGITASSIGVLTKILNLRPTAIKIDPYLNVDAGTMSPFEHGETFVLDDGTETDLDLGNYERFLDVKLTNDSNLTTGKVYQAVIARERKGEYLGKTVQIIPHITNEIMNRILDVSTKSVDNSNTEPDVCVIELGGTIGDIESMPFVEALRQLQLKVGPDNFCLVHVSMIPIVGDGEQKTKPTQHSVKELRSLGIAPDFIVCRSKVPVTDSSREKIALFCNVPVEHVLSIHDVGNIYRVPYMMIEQNLDALLTKRLQLDKISLSEQYITKVIGSSSVSLPWDSKFKLVWDNVIENAEGTDNDISIALVGKYTSQSDAYLSVISALRHSCLSTRQKLNLIMIESTNLEESMLHMNPDLYHEAWGHLRQANGIVVPGGFGNRGIEGMIQAIRYVRENHIPFLGICLGMQVAVIEFSRNILGLISSNSEEFDKFLLDDNMSIVFMPEGSRDEMGGTMRLGSRKTIISENSQAFQLYSNTEIYERHRHRYEVNPKHVQRIQDNGLIFSGRDETNQRMEIIELHERFQHPYFIATQFHPEFKSRPQEPSPVFLGLLKAAKQNFASRQNE